MAIIDKILGRKRSIADLSATELRKEEILIGKQRDRLLKKIETLAEQKQKIFVLGAKQKTPELRKALAQDFELKSQEQVLCGRELTLRSKELMTVARLRLVKENNEKGRALGRLKLTSADVGKISAWIEDDTVSQEMYNDRLDLLLDLGAESDRAIMGSSSLSQPGQELINMWEQLDRGKVEKDEAFTRADSAIRNRQAEGTK